LFCRSGQNNKLLEFGSREIAAFNLVAALTFAIAAAQKGERARVMKYVPPYE
jgi:hypothetical protein